MAPTIKTTDTIKHVIYFLDGVLAGNVTSAPYAYSLDTTTLTDGSHILNVTAVTASGVKWFEEFTLATLNDLGAVAGGGSSPQFVLTSVDLLILQALLVVLVLAIVLRIGTRKKGPEGPRKKDDDN